jgi:hypothetical protein
MLEPFKKKGCEMSPTQPTRPQFATARNQLLLNLAINGLLPSIVYIGLRPQLPSDAAALAVAGAIPAVRTIALWRRRVDWIGVYAVLGFAVALALYTFLGGNALLLKIHGALLTGTLGLVLLASAALKRPLLLAVFQAFGPSDSNGASLFDSAALDPASRARIAARVTFSTTVIGLVLAADAVVHVILALTLSTDAYLGLARVTSLAIVGSGVALLWLRRQRNTALAGS